jgi:hypothetical protein
VTLERQAQPAPLATSRREHWIAATLFGVSLLLLGWNVRTLGSWIVDDAAITYSYARTFAEGNGLRAQPGAPAVEGFSNPLWLATLVPFFLTGSFHPVVVPKALSLACILGIIGLSFLTLRGRREHAALTSSVAALILTSSPPLVIWSFSGLENASYGLAVALMVFLHTRALLAFAVSPLRWLVLGLAAFLVAASRPEGILFSLAPPVTLALAARAGRPEVRRAATRGLWFSAGLAVPLGALLLSRRLYFGAWLPNTYWAKDASSAIVDLERLIRLELSVIQKLYHLGAATLGPWSVWILVFCAWAFARSRRDPVVRLWWLYAAIAGLCFVLLPDDWMPEKRFGTPFVIATASGVSALAISALFAVHPRRRTPLCAIAAAVLVSMLLSFRARVREFAVEPTVPAQAVARVYAERFADLASTLAVPDPKPSVLLPDIGGVLYCAPQLRVYDLAGLADPVLAHANDQPTAMEYILEVARPTFVHSHPPWGDRLGLERHPGFQERYAPLYVVGDRRGTKWGDWLRRDIAEKDPRRIEQIRPLLASERPERGVEWRTGSFCGD